MKPSVYLFPYSGSIFHGYSKGYGLFFDRAACPAHKAAFSVIKIRSTRAVLLRILSPGLRWFFEEASSLSPPDNAQDYFTCSLEDILPHYWRFQLLFWQLGHEAEWARFIPVIHLFVQGFLVEKNIWKSFGLRELHESGILVADHWREMEGIETRRDLDDCERLFEFHNTKPSTREPVSFVARIAKSKTEGDLVASRELSGLPTIGMASYFDNRRVKIEEAATTGKLWRLSHLLSIGTIYDVELTNHPCPLARVHHKCSAFVKIRGHACPRNLLSILYLSAAKAGHAEIIGWLMDRFPVPPSNSVVETAAYHGRQNVLDYLAARGIDVTRFWGLQQSPLNMRILMRKRWEQKRVMQDRVGEEFRAEHEAFLKRSQLENTSDALSNFAEALLEPEKVWKQGFQTIRELLDNRIPSGIHQIFGCVQVSRAMRACLAQNTGNDHQLLTSETSSDLARWRFALGPTDHALFNDIAKSIWDQDLSVYASPSNWKLCNNALLEHFRSSFEKLIASTRMACVFSSDETCPDGGRWLCDIQDDFTNEFAETDSTSTEEFSIPQTYTHTWTPEHKPDPRYRDLGIIAQPVVILLAATTIFMTIVTFFIGTFYAMNAIYSP